MGAMTIARRGTLASASVFLPSTIAGLQAWYDASAITGLANSDPVTTWTDGSTSARNATQATSSKRPTYVTGVQNGKPVVRFDGVDDVLLASVAGTLTGVTAVLVSAIRNNFGGFRALISANQPAQNDFSTGFAVDTGNGAPGVDNYTASSSSHGATNTDLQTSSRAFGAFSIKLVELPSAAGTSTLYVNGAAEGTQANAAGNINIGEIRLGARYYNSNEQAYGAVDLAEVLIYSGSLSAGNRNSLTAYLGTKYGITVV